MEKFIEIKNLEKTYTSKNGKETHALKNINLNFDNQGLYFIIGESGSGKSTLLNMIGSLDSFDGGEIIYNNTKLNEYTKKELDEYRNKHVGFVFQDFNLIEDLTVYENISLTLEINGEENIEEKVNDVLKQMKMERYKHMYPNELSGGEIQRVTIARAVSKESSIIIADEPTGSLDSDNSSEIIKILKKISKHRLVIVVTHNKNIAVENGDYIIRLSDGKVVKETLINKNDNVIVDTRKYDNSKKMHFKTKYNISKSFLNNRKIKLWITILLTAFSFALFLTSLTMGNFKGGKAGANSISSSNIDYINVSRYGYPKKDIIMSNIKMSVNELNELNNKYGSLNFKPVYTPGEMDELLNFERSVVNKNYGNDLKNRPLIKGFYELNNEDILKTNFEMIAGRFPNLNDEVVITKKTYDIFNNFGIISDGIMYEVEDFEDVLNKKIILESNSGNVEFLITGILDTKANLNSYEFLSTLPSLGIVEKKIKDEYSDILFNGFHSLLIVNKGYIDNSIHTEYRTVNDYRSFFFTSKFGDNFLNTIKSFNLINKKDNYLFLKNKSVDNMKENDIIISDSIYINDLISENEKDFKTCIETYLETLNIDDLVALIKLNIDEGIKKEYVELNTDLYIKIVYDKVYKNTNISINNIYPENVLTKKQVDEMFLEELVNNMESYSEKIIIKYYDYAEDKQIEISEKEYNVVGFKIPEPTDISNKFYITNNNMENIRDNEKVYNYALSYFMSSNKNDLSKLIDESLSKVKNEQIRINNYIFTELFSIDYTLESISKTTIYSSFIFMAFSIILLSNYISSNLVDKKHEIGILKALGVSDKDVFGIFMIQSFIISIFSLIVSLIFSMIGIKILNNILSNDFNIGVRILNLSVIEPIILTLIVVIIALSSTLLTIKRIYKFSPIDAIKKK